MRIVRADDDESGILVKQASDEGGGPGVIGGKGFRLEADLDAGGHLRVDFVQGLAEFADFNPFAIPAIEGVDGRQPEGGGEEEEGGAGEAIGFGGEFEEDTCDGEGESGASDVDSFEAAVGNEGEREDAEGEDGCGEGGEAMAEQEG